VPAGHTGDGFELAAPVERDTPGNRMNDAKCDPAGRLFAGTTAFDFAPHSAALYRVGPDWSFEQMIHDVTQSNGIAWSPVGKMMYFIDSSSQSVDVFDYDVGTGSAGNRRRLVTIGCGGGGGQRRGCFRPGCQLLGDPPSMRAAWLISPGHKSSVSGALT
jgi:sugar lactone lactonase YvrE